MQAFRQFDTNSATQQSLLGISPPEKKCDKSPSKVPLDSDLLFDPRDLNCDPSFKFDLQSVTCSQPNRAKESSESQTQNWQSDLTSKISSFQQSFVDHKASLLDRLRNSDSAQDREDMVEKFLQKMEAETISVKQSHSYANMKVRNNTSPLKKAASFSSPNKATIPSKENSPLKKMGSLKKQSRKAQQENSQSPLKVFGKSDGPSPQKQSMQKKTLKHAHTVDASHITSFESPQKASPLKKSMRTFMAPESPEKRVADLGKPCTTSIVATQKPNIFFGHKSLLKTTNLLKSRKTCEKRKLNITDLVSVDQKIVSFGQFISGQTLGNRLLVTNKTNSEQTFSIMLNSRESRFAETAYELMSTFHPDDLPFQVSQHDKCKAINSQAKFKSWAIENPQNRKLQQSMLFTLNAHESKEFIVVLQTPMSASCSDMLAKIQLQHIKEEEEPECFVQKRINNGIQKSTQAFNKVMEVILCGKLQNPVLICQKSITSKTNQHIPVIPLVAKISQGVQKFKIPFKAAHMNTSETDFEFIFIKSVQPPPTENRDSLEEKQFIVFDCMTFFCLPAVLKVGPDAPSVLSVQLQINHDKLSKLPQELLQTQMTKLLVARIKNTKLIQSFYLTINLTE